ncbi:MAG: hypothetical protein C0405_10485, partial [Desulfovibrio sp.]|nr:hypothetical protein [Desulfovibrio sp.]
MTISSALARARQAWVQAPLAHRLACLGALLFYLFQVSIYFNFTEDDPGISFRYAANLAEGHGLVYNPGDRVEGYSNFGFVLVLAFIHKFIIWGERAWMILVIKFLNLGVGALCLYLVWRVGRDHMNWPRWLAYAAVLVTAAMGPFAINVASPLETTSLAAWLLLAIWLTMDYLKRREPTWGQAVWLGLTWLMAALWRIDAPLLVLALGIFAVIHRGIKWKKQDLAAAAVVIGGYGLYTLFRYLYFGDILPNTFYAKVNLGNDWRHPYPYLLDFMRAHGGKALVYATLLLALLRWRGAAMAAAMIFCVHALYVNKVGGDWMTGYRFFAPVMPLLALVYGDAAFRLWQIVTGLGGERLLRVLKP